jgi:hypothetical protein
MSSKIEIKNLSSLIKVKDDLEYRIRLEQSKIISKFFLRNSKKEDIDDIRDTIDTLDQQLAKVKLAIQIANTTMKDEDGNVNYINIYKLSILNRKLANLREIIYRGERLFEEKPDDRPNHKDPIPKRSLIKKDDYPGKRESVEKEIETLLVEISEIKLKLEKFNITNKVEVEIYDEFQNFIK